jgi:two-component system, cell cycle sensor histidine kinase and response regulator CckA
MRNQVDHTSFIEKQKQHSMLVGETKAQSPVNQIAILILTGVYAAVIMAAMFIFDVDEYTVLMIIFVFASITFLTFLLQRMRYWRNRDQKLYSLLQHIFEGSRGARMVTDNKGIAFYSNSKLRSLLGKSNKDLKIVNLKSLVAFFHDNPDAESQFKMLLDQAERGMTNSIQLFTNIEGEDLCFDVLAQPIADWKGFIHWRIDDITQKLSIDRSIREEREKLIDFTDNAPVGFFSVDEEGRFVFVNATFARWVGEDIETLLNEGRLHTYFVDPPENANPYDIKPKGGLRQISEMMMKGPAGNTFFASINQTVVKDEDGRVRTRAVVNDLTSERSMRQALQASEDKFQRFFDEAPLGIAIVEPNGQIEDCNTALEQMLGVEKEGLSHTKLEDLLFEKDRNAVMFQLKKLEQKERMKAPIEIQLKTEDGTPFPVQFIGRKFRESESIVLHFIDMTQQKVLEQQFVQSQKMQAIGQLAGGIAHDFNNLLTAMVGFCDLLLLRHKPGDPSFSDIMQIKQNANRAANLVRQLLAFSRQQTLQPKVQDVTDILTELSHLMRRLLGANIELEVMHSQDIGLVKVDEGQMEQVLINLAVNARDAMQEMGGGKLSITTSSFENDKPMDLRDDEMPPGLWTVIEVKDTGCGIPEENLTRILEPFFTTKDVGQGTGLGLATVYGIIRQTGGYLQVASEVGVGTTFTIYLPCVQENDDVSSQTPHDLEPEQPTDLTGTACILLVEDEDAVRTFSTRALTNKGYEVLSAESGEKALEIVANEKSAKIDLLITDVVMPNMDGPTLAQRLRQNNPNLKIIFISGYTEDRLKDHMGENISFLPKPFTLKQLAEKVKQVMDS